MRLRRSGTHVRLHSMRCHGKRRLQRTSSLLSSFTAGLRLAGFAAGLLAAAGFSAAAGFAAALALGAGFAAAFAAGLALATGLGAVAIAAGTSSAKESDPDGDAEAGALGLAADALNMLDMLPMPSTALAFFAPALLAGLAAPLPDAALGCSVASK